MVLSMAMYHLIGADGREYGPVSADQLRLWVREGRANRQTQVRPESSGGWQELGSVAEMADVFALGSAAPGLPPVGAAPPAIRSATNRANNKVAAGICGILLGGLGIHKFILGYTQAGLIMLLIYILTCGIGGIVMHVIGIIEGIIYLTKSDEEFVRIYVDGHKEWF
jgi:TM2 domain-containing membrane protein YozV